MLIVNDVMHRGFGNIELFAKVSLIASLTSVKRSYFSHNLPTQFMVRDCLAFILSAFRDFVFNVILMRTKKQMIGVKTFAIVAFVKYQQIIKYFAVSQNPRYAVDILRFVVKIPHTVSSVGISSSPFPTLTQLWAMLRDRPVLIDLTPEYRNLLFRGILGHGVQVLFAYSPRMVAHRGGHFLCPSFYYNSDNQAI
jgi:hypothetical protein